MNNNRRITILSPILLFCTIAAGCKSRSGDEGFAPTVEQPRDVCDLRNDASLTRGQVIRVKGQITGYHELVLYSNKCFDSRNMVKVEFDADQHERLFNLWRQTGPNKIDVSGEAIIVGQFEPDKGLLFGYPPRIIKVDDPGANEGTTVNKISSAALESFAAVEDRKEP